MGYMGMCRCEGYGFQAVYSRIGYINQSVWVQSRISFFRKLISCLKILARLGKQLLQDRGDLGSSSIGQQNLAELALLQVKGSRVPAAHPYPEIPKVIPPPHLGMKYTENEWCPWKQSFGQSRPALKKFNTLHTEMKRNIQTKGFLKLFKDFPHSFCVKLPFVN